MDSRAALKLGINGAGNVAEQYLSDLSDADLLVRPVPGANHIAWQLGHLIQAENWMMNLLRPGSMPDLPVGFAKQHDKETAASDDPKAFRTKDEYLKLMKEQRAATLKLLDTLSDAELDQPSHEKLRHFIPTVGSVFSMQGTHWMMHAGQWSVVRRKLGRPPLF
ncbi:MAG: DinB family protein [Pirellulales bacterium]